MSVDGEQERPWWQTPFRTFQTNLREIDADLDVDATLEYIVDFGANAWLLSTGGIISNYPSDLEFQTRNPALVGRASHDLIGDAVAAAHDQGVRLLCRMDFSKIATPIADLHPDWLFVAPDGQRQVYQGLVSVCPNGWYYQHGTLAVLDEIIDRYPVDGFFFNWFSFNEIDYSRTYHGVCHCGSCSSAYQAWGGRDLPTGPNDPDDPGGENYGQWRIFTAEVLSRLNGRVHDHIKSRRPDAALLQGHGRHSDVIFHEANNAVGRDLWPIATQEAVSVARTAHPELPVFVNSVAFIDMLYRLASEQPDHFAQYLVQAIARTAFPSTYVMGTPAVIPYSALHKAAEITRFHRDHAEIYDGLRPAAPVALVRPDPLRTDAASLSSARSEFEGLFLASRRIHVPVDIVGEESLSSVLGRTDNPYRVIVLGDLGRLDRDLTTALDEFVAQGGRLLLTGSTGLTETSSTLVSSGIAAVQSQRTGVEELRNSYILSGLESDRINDGTPLLPILGGFYQLTPAPGALSGAPFVSAAPFGPPEKCYGNQVTDIPGVIRNNHRNGAVTTLAWTAGRAYRETELTAIADHIGRELLVLLRGESPVRADAPADVDLTLATAAGRTVVHVLNLTGARRRGFEAPLPLRDVVVHLFGLPAGTPVTAVISGITVTTDGSDDTAVRLPELELFEVLVWGE